MADNLDGSTVHFEASLDSTVAADDVTTLNGHTLERLCSTTAPLPYIYLSMPPVPQPRNSHRSKYWVEEMARRFLRLDETEAQVTRYATAAWSEAGAYQLTATSPPRPPRESERRLRRQVGRGAGRRLARRTQRRETLTPDSGKVCPRPWKVPNSQPHERSRLGRLGQPRIRLVNSPIATTLGAQRVEGRQSHLPVPQVRLPQLRASPSHR